MSHFESKLLYFLVTETKFTQLIMSGDEQLTYL